MPKKPRVLPDDKYSLWGKGSDQRYQLKCNYPKFKNYSRFFFFFFFHFQNLHKNCNSLEKAWASDVICFWNYRMQNVGLFKCLKSLRARTLMDSQHVKGSEWPLKSARLYFCHTFLSLWQKISPKISVLLGAEILRLFGNIVISLSKRECLTRPIQIQIPQNQKWFSIVFAAFPEST